MTWLSFDDGYTREAVWDDVPWDTRWHFHAMVEACCASRRYDGRLRRADARRCSDVPDPDRSVRELIACRLVIDHGDVVEIESIDNFLPPAGERAENLLARKRKNQAAYRRRKCERGDHDRHCPAATCPERAARVSERVTGNPGTGRVGPGSPRPKVRRTTDADEVRENRVDHEVGDGPRAERADAVGEGLTAPPQSRKPAEITTARDDLTPDDQLQPSEVQLRSQAERGNAREATP